ncbi:MAG: NAD(P)H-binding protein [Bryobacteraceae bacterium]
MILITGATGTSGSEIAKQLSATGTRFRALVWDRRKTGPLSGLNVEPVEGDLGKPETLAKALEGIDRALLLSSPDERQVEFQGNFIDAAKRAGVRHVVKFSAIGAAPDSISKFLRWHAQTERQLEQSGMGHTHLRPSSFMQNFLQSAATIQIPGRYLCADRRCEDQLRRHARHRGRRGEDVDGAGSRGQDVYPYRAGIALARGCCGEAIGGAREEGRFCRPSARSLQAGGNGRGRSGVVGRWIE